MTATQLIEQLQKLVAEHGDLGVTVWEPDYGFRDANQIQLRAIGNDKPYLAIICNDE